MSPPRSISSKSEEVVGLGGCFYKNRDIFHLGNKQRGRFQLFSEPSTFLDSTWRTGIWWVNTPQTQQIFIVWLRYILFIPIPSHCILEKIYPHDIPVVGYTSINFHLVGGLEHDWIIFPWYMGCHPSHWRTHIFQDGYCTTNQSIDVHEESRETWFTSVNCVPHGYLQVSAPLPLGGSAQITRAGCPPNGIKT